MPSTGSRPRRTQEERKAESDRRILRAARDLFAKQGYMRTTLAEVGKAAGYTGGLVSHRFGSKEGLLKAVVERSVARFLSDQVEPAIENKRAGESLCSYIEIYLREVIKRESRIRALYVIMGEGLGSVPEIRDEIAWLNQSLRDRLAAVVQRGIDDGEFRSEIDAAAESVLVLGILRGVTMQFLADRKAFDIDALIPLVKQHVLTNLR